MSAIELVEKSQLTERPAMKSGDTVRVHVKVREGDKERIQIFEGIVIGHAPRRRARVVHRPQGVVRPGRRAHLPAALADDRQGRSGALGARAPREAVLPARPEGQGRAHEGNQAAALNTRYDMVNVRATRTLENALRRWGFHRVAGCDEVGRGCLAGPVVAGAVILDPARYIPGLATRR